MAQAQALTIQAYDINELRRQVSPEGYHTLKGEDQKRNFWTGWHSTAEFIPTRYQQQPVPVTPENILLQDLAFSMYEWINRPNSLVYKPVIPERSDDSVPLKVTSFTALGKRIIHPENNVFVKAPSRLQIQYSPFMPLIDTSTTGQRTWPMEVEIVGNMFPEYSSNDLEVVLSGPGDGLYLPYRELAIKIADTDMERLWGISRPVGPMYLPFRLIKYDAPAAQQILAQPQTSIKPIVTKPPITVKPLIISTTTAKQTPTAPIRLKRLYI